MGAAPGGSVKTCEAGMVRIVAGAVSLLAMAGSCGAGASAHMARSGWQYPVECCGGHDCYEIDPSELEPALGSWKIIATGQYFSASRVRRSPDGRYHRCSYNGDRSRTTNCLFFPEPSS